ncbi:MAG: hypothetical protein DDG59_11385 [Anaerolineae bacterium]|jgi:adenosylhomocysteine nucleosidase|nr:MAG: hypothetical protein DDG59_11385 [Anaerolineae bacterium]
MISDLGVVVVLISADAEWAAVKKLLCPSELYGSPFGEYFYPGLSRSNHPQGLIFFQGGWGKISAASSTQYVIDRFQPSLLFNLGTCGGIEGRIERGQIVLADKTLVYDLFEMMQPSEDIQDYYTTELDLSFLREPYPCEVTRHTICSADRDLLAEDIPRLVDNYGASVCDWESAAIAFVAKRNHIPLVILRGVSDLVGLSGGEAYGNVAYFHQATEEIMAKLLENFENWLERVDMSKI